MGLEGTEQFYEMQIFWNFLRRHSTFPSKLWQTSRRQRLSCHNMYIHSITTICYAHLVLLVWWVYTFNRILLCVKRDANESAVILWEIKLMSLCFYVSLVPFMASLIHSLVCGSTTDVWNPKQEHSKCNKFILSQFMVLKVTEFINLDKSFTQTIL
jgi:hypothetical protein